ncbi:MAG TPA: putative Ig domain-containing protein [Thermoanaerobaculia bacterium]
MRVFARILVPICFFVAAFAVQAQIAGPNVNMVSGTGWPGGDPFLQRQNEPSVAASTRNPMHLLAGSNDYRTVDLPGLPDAEETGDAWVGLFKSLDGGLTWFSTLVPGYPQDQSAEGAAAPVKGFQAAADPMVRPGIQGMFFYSGIALNRGPNPASALFVARFNDFNNREGADSIRYLGMSLVDRGTGGGFVDKPSLAVDLPRSFSSTCTAGTQTLLTGNIYVAYSIIQGTGSSTTSKVMFSRSTNCASSWSTPFSISGTNIVNQGSAIAVDTISGNVYVAWRRFNRLTQTDAILVAKSTDRGQTFKAPVVVRSFAPFEQGTTNVSFRTSAYPTIVTDASGRIYVAWSERTGPNGDGRIMLTTSTDATNWSTPVYAAPSTFRGHQLMPALSFSSSKLMLVYYDLREDTTVGMYTPIPFSGGAFVETRLPAGDLNTTPARPDKVFTNFLMDAAPLLTEHLLRRHTLDLRASQASPAALPAFDPSQRVSRYRFGTTDAAPSTVLQLAYNPPNFPMFKTGTVPFFGDYIDIGPQFPFIGSLLNNLPFPAPVFHAVWTDNRDVRPPADGHWENYTPVAVNANTPSKFNPLVNAPPCVAGQTGMRNQNIYTARISAGLVFGSPGNAKQTGTIQRAFVVNVQNTRTVAQSYRLQIVNQPIGGKATFVQFPLNAPAVTTLDVTVNPKSTTSRPVFVSSTIAHNPIGVLVTEIIAVGGGASPGGLTSATVLNPDIANPDIANPDIANPDIANPDIANPDIANPDIANPDIANGSVSDTTWDASNTGNTTASYSVKLLQTGTIPSTYKLQLLLHSTYQTPVASGCLLKTERHENLIANFPHPTISTLASITNPDLTNPVVPTLYIAPHDTAKITVRVVDPFHKGLTIDASKFLTPVVIAHAVNTADLNSPNPQPRIALIITTGALPDGASGTPFAATMAAIGGVPPYTWSLVAVDGPFTGFPPGMTLHANGTIDGTPSAPGTYTFTIRVTDFAGHAATRQYTINVSGTATIEFVVQPPPAVSFGTPFDVAVRLRDASGAVLPGVDIALTTGKNPQNAPTFEQPLIATTDALGIATFHGISHPATGSGFTLLATATALNVSGESNIYDVTAAIPGTVAAGFGQLVVIPGGESLPDPSTWANRQFKVQFIQGNTVARGFAFPSPSSISLLFARLPFNGDGVDNATLAPGHAFAHVTWDTGSIPDTSIGVSTTPGAPVIRFLLALNAAPGPNDPCGSGVAAPATPITTINPGQGIGISAFGTDTTGAVAIFHQGESTFEVPALCGMDRSDIGEVAPVAVPSALFAGSASISIRTSVNGIPSPPSAPVFVTVVIPIP